MLNSKMQSLKEMWQVKLKEKVWQIMETDWANIFEHVIVYK